ncbi:hypothetical protein N7530_004891 [Penicillium desertorum]|uniref:Uncharacterized protein n=1 Tax=Penicillium desertorum TaxID=1303715 RepID=A0A9W9WZK5_9EURO|nr:hypothetical protein N7530_004891 [Penicillium desertorum]
MELMSVVRWDTHDIRRQSLTFSKTGEGTIKINKIMLLRLFDPNEILGVRDVRVVKDGAREQWLEGMKEEVPNLERH